MTGFLLVNPRSGDGEPTPLALRRSAESLGVEVHVLEPEDDPAALAREATAEVLGMAGGDGSLAAVAAVAVARNLPFVAIPFGTRNHFARDLGLDRGDPLGTLAAFGGEERRVDIGRVNGRLFLNNVSVGAYARLVHRREHHRRRRLALARGRALLVSLLERHGLSLTVDGTPASVRVLLVANGAYELDLLTIGERASLEEGRLHLYLLRGWLPQSWEEQSAASFTVGSGRPTLRTAIDGEPALLSTPLTVTIEPGALRVLVPPA